MEEPIDGDWIRRHLPNERGQKAELARAMGIDADHLSKILSGDRKVQPTELPKLLRFFGLEIRPVAPEAAQAILEDALAKLNPDGLALAQRQIADLASTPALARPSEAPPQEP